jgi:hypothetical protein
MSQSGKVVSALPVLQLVFGSCPAVSGCLMPRGHLCPLPAQKSVYGYVVFGLPPLTRREHALELNSLCYDGCGLCHFWMDFGQAHHHQEIAHGVSPLTRRKYAA